MTEKFSVKGAKHARMKAATRLLVIMVPLLVIFTEVSTTITDITTGLLWLVFGAWFIVLVTVYEVDRLVSIRIAEYHTETTQENEPQE